MHLTGLLTALGLVTTIIATPTPVLQPPSIDLDHQFTRSFKFIGCTPKQQDFIRTTMKDVHRLNTLGANAVRIAQLDHDVANFKLFERNGTLTTPIANQLLFEWFGERARMATSDGLWEENVKLGSEEAIKRIGNIGEVFVHLENILVNADYAETVQYNCMPSIERCKSNLDGMGLPSFVKPVLQPYQPEWQHRGVYLCPGFFDMPSLEQTLRRAKPLSGLDPMPAPYAVLGGLLPIWEDIVRLDHNWGPCRFCIDCEVEINAEPDRWSKLKKAREICAWYAIMRKDTWAAFALKVAEAVYRSDGPVAK